ncbi:MAG: hypothetical protein DRJ65_00020 [Acidobacteria bacterium]|nr:MAG: hypothetical protein DRJ65_00020 [Acidobacteriota bacterium]
MPKLRPYQREGVEWLRHMIKALLVDDQGLGKTPQALCSLPQCGRALVVAPAVVKSLWAAEARIWRPDYHPTILSGGGSFRWPEPGELVITNYEILPPCSREVTARRKKGQKSDLLNELQRQAKALPQPPDGVVLVADEAHRLGKNKTYQTLRFRNLRTKVLRRDGRCWGLTGTPLLNRPLDLWNLVTSIGAQKEFGSYPWFCRAFNSTEGDWGLEWGKPNLDMLIPALKRIAKRRRKADVLPELPPKTYRTIPVDLGDEARKLADAAIEALAAAGIDLETATAQALEIAAGRVGFTELSRAMTALAKAKTDAAIALVEDFEAQGEPVVVLSDHRYPVETIASRKGWEAIHGGVPSSKRGEIVERFQAGEYRGLAMTTAVAIGITLTRSCHVLRIDRNWVQALNLQAEDRLHRFGQKRGVIITDLVADHYLDERVDDVLKQKTELASVIDGIAG